MGDVFDCVGGIFLIGIRHVASLYQTIHGFILYDYTIHPWPIVHRVFLLEQNRIR